MNTDPSGLDDYEEGYADAGNVTASDSDAIEITDEYHLGADLAGGNDRFKKARKRAKEEGRGYSDWAEERYINRLVWIGTNKERFKKAAQAADCCICPEWLIAVWWDERLRMALDEKSRDDMADALGVNTSTGPFQMKGDTAKDVIDKSGNYKDKYKKMSGDELQDAMQDNFDLAAVLAADRMCQIMEGYKKAGWSPCAKDSLSAIALIGTLYSQGLGNPKANPVATGRGEQIAKWAAEAKEWFNLPDCPCDCNKK